jgi:phosphatidylinositol alpha-1,6-mannosyltransferase
VAYYLAKFLLTQGRTPVVYATHWKVGLVPALLAPLVGMKVLIGAHGMEVLKETTSFRRRLIRLTYRRAHRGLAVSRYTRQALIRLGVPEEKVAWVPNGVDVEFFRPGEKSFTLIERHGLKGKKVILTLARLVPRKGQDQVIRALPRVLQQVPNAVYLLAGKGGDEPRLRALAQSLGLADRVLFAGHVPAQLLADYYNLADIYIMVSREIEQGGDVEGFGITFLEAAACGLPAIGGRSGGIPDAIVEGQTGLLVDPEDTDQIAEAILRLLTEEPYARRLGCQGRQRVVETLQWSQVARRCLQLEDDHP